MNHWRILSLCGCFLLTSCSTNEIAQSLRYTKTAPDEFQVIAQQPLETPTTFELTPPEPGKERVTTPIREEAKHALFHKKLMDAPNIPSVGENSLMSLAGTKEANIRSLITEDGETIKKQRLKHLGALGELISWAHPKEDTALDPVKEKERLSSLLKDKASSKKTSDTSF